MELKSDTVCPVCLEAIGKINCCVTACNHTFHTSCLMQCNGLCPLCRTTVIQKEKEEDKFFIYDDGEEDIQDLYLNHHTLFIGRSEEINREDNIIEEIERVTNRAQERHDEISDRIRANELAAHCKSLKIKDLEQRDRVNWRQSSRRNNGWREMLWSPEKPDYCTIS